MEFSARTGNYIHRWCSSWFFNARGQIFWKPISGKSIQVIEGETWDLLAHSDLALAASGTVTVEAALLGCPMVTFYIVTAASWQWQTAGASSILFNGEFGSGETDRP